MSDIDTYMREEGWRPPGFGRRGHLKTEPGPFVRYGWQDHGRLRWENNAAPGLEGNGSLRWCGWVDRLSGGWRHWRGQYQVAQP